MAHIERLGLSSLCQIPALLVNHGLLTALVEHFHSKTNTFHLPQGEMIVTPEDIYQILRIPFNGPRVSYDTVPRVGTAALCDIFQRQLAIGRVITWEELVHTYGPRHRLASVLAIFLICFLVLDRG